MEKCAFIDKEVGIPLSLQDVKNYFDYENDFWNYFNTHSKTLPHSKEALDFYGIFFLEEKDIVTDFKIGMPKVEDLFTAKIAVHEIKRAHDLYKRFGMPFELSEDEYEARARQEEKNFKNYYISIAEDNYEPYLYEEKELESITKSISFYDDKDEYLGDFELETKKELVVPDNASSMTLEETITYTPGEMSYNIICEYFIKDKVRVIEPRKVM